MNTRKLKIQGIICARYEDYALRLDSGWVQDMIVEELRIEGYVLSTNYFSRCFSKARKKKTARGPDVKQRPDSKPASLVEIKDAETLDEETKPKQKESKPMQKFSIPVMSDEELF